VNPFQVDSQQTVLVEGLTGPNGADRLFITTGFAQLMGGGPSGAPQAFSGLIEPTLTAGQFRRAIATAAPATLSVNQMTIPPIGATQRVYARWAVNAVEADWDDESGKIELRFETTTNADTALSAQVERLAFQVMVFAGP